MVDAVGKYHAFVLVSRGNILGRGNRVALAGEGHRITSKMRGDSLRYVNGVAPAIACDGLREHCDLLHKLLQTKVRLRFLGTGVEQAVDFARPSGERSFSIHGAHVAQRRGARVARILLQTRGELIAQPRTLR